MNNVISEKPRVSDEGCNVIKAELMSLRSRGIQPEWNMRLAELYGGLEMDIQDARRELYEVLSFSNQPTNSFDYRRECEIRQKYGWDT